MSHYKPYPAYKDSGVEWLGRVPEHWDIRSVKTLARLDGGAGFPDDEQGQSDNPIPFFKVAELASGLRDTANTVTEETAKRLGAKIFPPSTLVFAKVGAALLLNRRCLLEMPACLDNNMMALLPGTYESQWLFWVFCTLDMGLIANPGAVPSINQEQVGKIRLGVPTLAEQKSIAQSLRRETARIDALIEKKTRFIELLREKRQALITHAVTKGLDPNVKMKDSGVEWLGEVPEHWEMVPLKYVTPSLTVGIVVNPSDYVTDEGLPFLYGGDIGEGVIFAETARRISPDHSQRNAKTRLNTGDLVTVRVGAPGVTAVVPPECEGGNCASVMLIRRGAFNSDWLCYTMNSRVVRYQVEVVQYGAAQEQFNISHAVDFLIPVPPLQEQAQIATVLNLEGMRVDALLSKTERSITLLKERRSALITAAVTGQIDLREAV